MLKVFPPFSLRYNVALSPDLLTVTTNPSFSFIKFIPYMLPTASPNGFSFIFSHVRPPSVVFIN
ncbi:hypothetical protein [Terrisporobacter mayombei]|uniref:hypothetical protein n=1 Tax=Terrisporobacter mayombei TaxID=1541 RepID=UPI001D16E485|nr:hypothetical protein [Terrisporobacter mayombei]MCC3868264.1 hypothetical protein [Terrisporobacter mayombei]